MRALRQTYDSMPATIEAPEQLRSQHVEVVFLVLDEDGAGSAAAMQDWPEGLFERTAGAWQGEPLRRAHHNTDEFRRVSGLQIEDWEMPQR